MNEDKDIEEVTDDAETLILESEDTTEEIELEDFEENSSAKMKHLRDKLKKCEQEKMQHLEALQSAKADFLNTKKRLQDEQVKTQERMVNVHIEKIIPLADSFHMAMSNKETWEAVNAEWRKGVESIHNQLHTILDGYNVSEINPEGEDFDPNLHEAMINVQVDDEKMHNKIISVIQNGFVRTINGTETLIRPARVTVGEYQN